MTQGFTVRPGADVFAVGRGVGPAEGAGNTGYWSLAIGLWEIGEALSRGVEAPDEAGKEAADQVAGRMREAAKADPIFENAGSAVTALWFPGGKATLIHAGDCQAVRLRNGTAQALTTEHTLERDSREKGIPNASPYIRAVLLRMLGALDPARADPQVLVPDLAPDDRVLLMSTDVATRVSNMDLATALDGTPAHAGRRLLELALARKAPEAAVVVIDLN